MSAAFGAIGAILILAAIHLVPTDSVMKPLPDSVQLLVVVGLAAIFFAGFALISFGVNRDHRKSGRTPDKTKD